MTNEISRLHLAIEKAEEELLRTTRETNKAWQVMDFARAVENKARDVLRMLREELKAKEQGR